ncbi:hypothetical protein L1987_37286 [Smallanthus sonchifolius]|uniref:Uncharacterized protein n=1 Tax=Smallanthus sonchifolius TaxID=185202 RepID=A0ACB9HGT1_9ASTR|nr:hypothetical protein L1987_37286 [Smallanthus sonchifolius]
MGYGLSKSTRNTSNADRLGFPSSNSHSQLHFAKIIPPKCVTTRHEHMKDTIHCSSDSHFPLSSALNQKEAEEKNMMMPPSSITA